MDDEKLAPVQAITRDHKRATVPWAVHIRAYEVYCAIFGKQDAMIDLDGRGCRGGFGSGELIAFLYAHSFPQPEWSQRFEEALRGMNV